MSIKAGPQLSVYNNKDIRKGAMHTKFCPPMMAQIDAKSIDKKNYTLTARASTMSIDRDGEIILPTAFDLTHFLKCPMFLWNHRWFGQPEDALGCVLDCRADGDAFMATFQYDVDEDERAAKIWRKVTKKNPSIRGFSVGFRMLEWVTAKSPKEMIDALPEAAAQALRRGDVWLVHTKVELIEISQVLIPCNTDSHADPQPPETVEELVGLASSAPETKHTERTDTMNIEQVSAKMDQLAAELKTVSANQQTFASVVEQVALSQKAVAEALVELKKAPATTPAPEAPKAAEPELKSVEDFKAKYPALFNQVVETIAEALN